jgi:hypothetical protein
MAESRIPTSTQIYISISAIICHNYYKIHMNTEINQALLNTTLQVDCSVLARLTSKTVISVIIFASELDCRLLVVLLNDFFCNCFYTEVKSNKFVTYRHCVDVITLMHLFLQLLVQFFPDLAKISLGIPYTRPD